jgi:GcrA cell cycle regulator
LVERLTKLWADGDTAQQIAIELGVTRNSVIGKVHRLGLPGRPKRPAGTIPRRRKPRSQRATMRIVRPAVRGNTALAARHARERQFEPQPELIENIIPIGQRCSTLELSEGKCRWPIGDPGKPDFFFCGGKTIEGLPYCGYHARIAYQPAVDRRRDRRTAQGALAQAAE